jgi:peptide/nickel transport system substrate-binding protein
MATRSPSSCARNAKFHDGTPVTAKDVKWSFDRAVTVGGFPTFQMAAGSLEKPEQFEVVDEHTFRSSSCAATS